MSEDDDNYADDGYVDEPSAESEAIPSSAHSNNEHAMVHRNNRLDDEPQLAALPAATGGALASIHQGYLSHIRALQRTNGALTKKVDHLVALQGEHTRMKLIARQQRLLREVSLDNEKKKT